MASLAVVTEYYTIPVMVGGQVAQIAQEPPLAEQSIDFTAGATATAALNARTNLVRIKCNAAASFLFSTAGTAAATTNQVLSAGETEYKGVAAGQGYKISFIAAATGF